MKIDTTSKETIKKSIVTIANDLIINKALKVNDKTFSFIDIEVYFWHDNHPDYLTEKVNHNREKGQLEAHRYGIDISLGNQKEAGYGGILICGLFDNQKKRVIEKPLVWRTLFNSLKVSDNTIELIEKQNPWTKTFRAKRNNLGRAKNEDEEKYSDYDYKFLARDRSIFTKYEGKEKIFKNVTKEELTDEEVKELLGYKLSR